jgi:hypothetical protein
MFAGLSFNYLNLAAEANECRCGFGGCCHYACVCVIERERKCARARARSRVCVCVCCVVLCVCMHVYARVCVCECANTCNKSFSPPPVQS